MSVESLTYADLAGRLGTSPEAARSLVRRLRLRDRWPMTEQYGSTSIQATYSTGPCLDVHHMVTGRTLTLSKPRSSSFRPRSLSLKHIKAPLKSIDPD